MGTLKAAKKRGIITFEGQLLLKGSHDKVPNSCLSNALCRYCLLLAQVFLLRAGPNLRVERGLGSGPMRATEVSF
jgi:hypothetical protein